MTYAVHIAMLAVGFGLGCSFGVLLLSSLRLSAKYDREAETMLDDVGYEAGRSTVTHDYTSNRPHRVF